MLIYSNPFYITDNGNGYDLDVRDAICASCNTVIDRQERYRGKNKEWMFGKDKKEWRFCPFCGEKLFDD